MIKQCYISKSLDGFDFKARYNLCDYSDSNAPLVMFGMYRIEDLNLCLSHDAPIVIVWCGSDAKDLSQEWGNLLKTKQIKNYANSIQALNTLLKKGIESEYLPISPIIPNGEYHPLGDCVYFYASSPGNQYLYGHKLVQEIKVRIKHNVIMTYHNTYSPIELVEVRKKCFINLRLTLHDGCPSTNLEMGMMGRKSIYNGDLPHSIAWKGVNDICESIEREYQRRKEDHSNVSNDFKKFMDIGNNWLNYGM